MKNSRWRLFWFNVLTTIGILVVAELISRAVLTKIYNRNFDSKLIVEHKYFDSPGLKENATGNVWGKVFHTDGFACRKPAKAYDQQKKKWLFIGDSVTEGVGVDDDSVFSSIVFSHQDSFNILNYSLIGYSDFDYLNLLTVILSGADTSIAGVTIFFCLNDVYGRSKTGDLPVMARRNLAGRINAFLQNNYCTYKLIKLYLYQHSDRYFKYDLQFYRENDEHFMAAMNILNECSLLTQAVGIRINVVMLPYCSQLSGDDAGDNTPQQLVGRYCKLHKISFFDPMNYLGQIENPESLYLFADEIHFSNAGHRAMANYILSQ